MADQDSLVRFAQQIYLRKVDQYGGGKTSEYLFELALDEAEQFQKLCEARFAKPKPASNKKTTTKLPPLRG